MASPGSQAASRTDPGSRASNSSSGKSSGSSGGTGKNNFPGYRGPEGTENADTSSAGVKAPVGGLTDTGQRTSWGARIYSDSSGQKIAASPERVDAADAYNSRLRDFGDEDNTLSEDLGNAIASVFGVSEIAPKFDLTNTNPNADWGFDPVKAALTVGGAVVGGVPSMAAGAAYKAYKSLNGPTPWVANLGPAVFGKPDPVPGAPKGLLSNQQGQTSAPALAQSAAAASRVAPVRSNTSGTQATQGLIRDTAPALSSAPVPTAPASPPASTPAPVRTDYGFPTPTEKYGPSQTGWYYDPSTGTLVPKAA